MEHSSNWSYGIDASYMRSLVSYWLETYDWRIHEKKFNDIGLKSTTVDGLRLVFHEVNGGKDKAILLLHGWPGSILEFHEVISKFKASVAEEYSIICPSLPGYGFSSPPTTEGYSAVEVSLTFHRLMAKLHYRRFIVQGGDYGSFVAQVMAYIDPAPIIGLHINFCTVWPSPGYMLFEQLKIMMFDDEGSKLRAQAGRDMGAIMETTGYFHEQATKPETLGFALSDSPVGLAAWIVEKFQGWSDPGRFIEDKYSRDDLLTNVMIYWLTNTITSSMRLYKESFGASIETIAVLYKQVTVPVCISSSLMKYFHLQI